MVRVDPWVLSLTGLAVFAMALRLAGADQQSAYMDEGTNVLTGRMLIEQHAVYAEILNWAYGSYLWPLVAGLADAVGGLRMVRGVTAVCGVAMVLATAWAAAQLAPNATPRHRRNGVALLAGGMMAVAPTAIGVGRFGTYDALAGAAFMLGVTLLISTSRPSSPFRLLFAAALLFVAFLAKYLVAIYFPFVCVSVVLAGWISGKPRLRLALHNFGWFVVPLSVACAAYALVFMSPLLTLLSSSLHYGDLRSPDPLREYVWTRPELWLLVAVAVVGWRQTAWNRRLVAVGGAAIIMAFQLAAHPDFDFWKHSIYVIYFLAPLAALAWLAVPQHTGTWRVLALLAGGLAAIYSWSPTIQQADRLIDFYPNLNPSIEAIDANIADSALVLTDDTALRYYLYPQIPTDRVFGPFFFTYRSQDGLEAYRQAISDRFFDAIVLDGGVTPQGAAIGQQLGQTIRDFYQPVYSHAEGAFTVEVFRPVRPPGTSGAENAEQTWPVEYTFDKGLDNFGAHPDAGDWQAGLQVAQSADQTWQGHLSLRFTPTPDTSTLSLRRTGPVTRMRARIYVVAADGGSSPLRIGFVGWDTNWQWHDDGFRWQIPPASWTTITWDLPNPGDYAEVGLKLPPNVSEAYLGSFELDP